MESKLAIDVENTPHESKLLKIITEIDSNSTSKTDLQTKDNIELADKGFSANETVFTHNFEVYIEREYETSYDSVLVGDLKSEEVKDLPEEEAAVLMDTDDSNILLLDKVVGGSNVTDITQGQSELQTTVSHAVETNEHQVCKDVAPLYNCDIPEQGEGNNTEMPAAPPIQSNINVQPTVAQISVTDSKVMISAEENSQDSYLTDHRQGRHLKSIYVPDVGNKWYDVKGNLVTRPIDPKKLPHAFGYLPIYGRPKSKAKLAEFEDERIREFVGFDLNDQEFDNLAQYCRSDLLETGSEIVMMSKTPTVPYIAETDILKSGQQNKNELNIVKKLKLRLEKDYNNRYPIKLKYRGLKQMPLSDLQDFTEDDPQDKLLEPGKDLIFRIRIYRGFAYSLKDRHSRSRHSVFSHDVVLYGRQRLCALRDRIVCPNDADVRVDVADRINDPPVTTAQDVFQSGFLFINNVFYVDTRGSCRDISAGLRAWAEKRGRGVFPCKDMTKVRLDELILKLGHPEVYMHQGNCEHLFTFSEIRLVTPSDPLKTIHYPTHTAVAQNQTIYCTACAEFGAKWIIDGCDKVPFDPAFFCDMCLKKYLYKDGQKLGNFKAYSYKINEINILKPTHGRYEERDFTEMDAPVSLSQRKRTLPGGLGDD